MERNTSGYIDSKGVPSWSGNSVDKEKNSFYKQSQYYGISRFIRAGSWRVDSTLADVAKIHQSITVYWA